MVRVSFDFENGKLLFRVLQHLLLFLKAELKLFGSLDKYFDCLDNNLEKMVKEVVDVKDF